MSNRKTLLPVLFIISTLSAPITASSYTNRNNIETKPPTITTNCKPYPQCIPTLEQSIIDETTKTTTDKSSKRPGLLPQPVNLPQDAKGWWEKLLDI